MTWDKCFKHNVAFDDECAECVRESRATFDQLAEVERLSHRVATLERQYGEMGTVAETAVARAEAAESKLSQLQLANEEKARKIAELVADVHGTDGGITQAAVLAILNGGQQ